MAKSNRGPSPEANRRNQARIRAQQEAAAAARRRRLTQLGIVGGVALLVIAIVASAIIIGQRGQKSTAGGAPSVSTTVTVDGATVPFAVDGSAVRVGPADAKAKVDLWVDYSCPHCQEFEAANSSVLNQLIAAGDVSVSYHNVQIVTDYGTEAGSAAACVAALDPAKWVAFNTSLYANHSSDTDGWDAADFRGFAAQQGVNDAALTCVANRTYAGWIGANTADSDKQGVTGTPTMVLNGQKSDTLSGDALTAKVNQLAGR
jgi:protein-disulfide isomerase